MEQLINSPKRHNNKQIHLITTEIIFIHKVDIFRQQINMSKMQFNNIMKIINHQIIMVIRIIQII